MYRARDATDRRRPLRLQQAAAVAHHRAADERQRRAAVGEEAVVEAPPAGALAGRPVGAELAKGELPQGVVEVAGIEGAAVRLLARALRVEERLLAEAPLGLFQGHPLGVEADRREIPDVSQERVLEESDLDQRIALAQARLPH